MENKATFQDTFFPASNPAGNEVIFGNKNQNSLTEEIFGTPDDAPAETASEEQKNDPSVSAEEEPRKSSKRRARPSSVTEKQILNEAKHWKSSYLQEAEKARAIEQENLALQQRLEDIDLARRESELKALTEREDNLIMQRKIARAAGENDYADEVTHAINQTQIQKELQAYDRYKTRNSYPSSQVVNTPQPAPPSNLDIQRQHAYDEFCYRNPWYGKNSSLTQLANQAMEQLTNVLELEEKEEAIFSTPFFNVIEDEIRDAYGLNQPSQQSNQQHYYSAQRPSTRVADVPRGNTTMAENYAASQRGGRTYTPEEVKKAGAFNLQMKVGNTWISREKAQAEMEKNKHRIVPINKGFRIEYS